MSPVSQHITHRFQHVQAWGTQFLQRWGLDLLMLLLLAVLAWTITRQFLGPSLFAWGDHPGQFMRFWYPLVHGIPDSGLGLWGVLSWNPSWYAGYPELQFYPPGTTLLGIGLYYLALAQLSAEQVYNLIPAIAFALPLFTCYFFLRFALAPLGRIPGIVAGLAAGFLAISLKPMWGGIDGVVIGLMGERLAFGFAPVVLLAGWWFIEKPSAVSMALASISTAWLLLLHPFHAPALVLAISLFAIARVRSSSPSIAPPYLTRLGRKALWILVWLLLSVGLVSWWILPLVARYKPYAAALVRANPAQVVSWFDASSVEWLWLAGLMALMLLAHPHPRVESTVGVLTLFVPLLLGGILFNDRVLLARLNITLLDPIRFIAEYYLALILLVACALGAVTSRFLWRIPWLAVICTVVLIITLRPYLQEAWRELRSHIDVSPMWTLDGMLQHPAFEGYWDALNNDPTSGRVFFVSYYLYLTDDNGMVTPTTINSLTPYLIGREIIGGTFSHWSPVARWLWVGNPYAEVLPAQIEVDATRQIFGKSWEQIEANELATNLKRLNVTTIVATTDSNAALALLESSPHFSPYWQNDYFRIYHLVTNTGEWVDAQGAVTHLVKRTALQWVIEAQESESSTQLLLKLSHYPLWQAHLTGQSIPITTSSDGLQEITLPAGGPYRLEVVYGTGLPETIGFAISLLSVCIIVLLLYFRRML